MNAKHINIFLTGWFLFVLDTVFSSKMFMFIALFFLSD